MKTISAFLKETDGLENKLSSLIYGRGIGTSAWTETNEAGCSVYFTDTYNDANNNGVRDCNEAGVLSSITICPEECDDPAIQ